MNEHQERMYDCLSELSGNNVIDVLTNWLGLQILDEDFEKFLEDEGYLEHTDEEDNE